MTHESLNNHHRDTLTALFAHPTSHNIRWVDVVSLIEAAGEIEEKHDGRFRVTLGSEIEVFDRSPSAPPFRENPAARMLPIGVDPLTYPESANSKRLVPQRKAPEPPHSQPRRSSASVAVGERTSAPRPIPRPKTTMSKEPSDEPP